MQVFQFRYDQGDALAADAARALGALISGSENGTADFAVAENNGDRVVVTLGLGGEPVEVWYGLLLPGQPRTLDEAIRVGLGGAEPRLVLVLRTFGGE